MQPDPVLARLQLLHPKAIDLSLGRLQRLLKALGDPQNRLPPVIHVAGTNGKGSTIAMLRSIHRAAGRHLHVYTSPHLVRFAERIVLGDHEISDAHLSELLLACEAANDGQPITLFEITTAAAFLAFAESPSDLLLLEVGLGGRFDATNVIPAPALSIITPVSLDHQHFLGDSLEQIAFEKAGILKPGVPAVIGRQPDEALRVLLARADEVGAPSFACGRNWTVRPDNGGMLYEGGGAAMAPVATAGPVRQAPGRQCRHGARRLRTVAMAVSGFGPGAGDRADLDAVASAPAASDPGSAGRQGADRHGNPD